MDQGLLVVILVVIVLAIGLGFGLMVRRRVAQFEQACRDRGWQVERAGGPAFDQRISGESNGVHWQYVAFEYHSGSTMGSSRTSTRYTRWTTTDVTLPGEVVIVAPAGKRSGQIAPIFQAMGMLGGFGRMIVELLVTRGLGGDAEDVELFLKLQNVQTGSEALRQAFTILATSEDAAAKLLHKGESALLAWASDPALKGAAQRDAVLFWGRGLMIPAEKMVTDIGVMEAMVNLGTSLANAVKGW